MEDLEFYKILYNPRDIKIISNNLIKSIIGLGFILLSILYYNHNNPITFHSEHSFTPTRRWFEILLFFIGIVLFSINILKPLIRKKAFIKADKNGIELRIKKKINKDFTSSGLMMILDFLDHDIDRMDTYYKYTWHDISDIHVDKDTCTFTLKWGSRKYAVAHTLVSSDDINKFASVIEKYNQPSKADRRFGSR